MHKINRFFNKIIARLFGEFWLPCRLCGMEFGSHEAAKNLLMMSCLHGVKVCKKCDARADKLNARHTCGIKYDPRWHGGER